MYFTSDLQFARLLDQQSMVSFRDQFLIPSLNGKEAIYFLGNSLGLQPKTAATYINEVLKTWADVGVEGFFKGKTPWLQNHESLIGHLADIVGALPHEVVIMNALTVNLHLMMISFYQPTNKRYKIICEAKAFSSDQYMLETHIRQRGLDPADVIVEINPRAGEYVINDEDIFTAIEQNKESLALVFFGGVNYYTGQLFDMKAISERAHKSGAKASFDLAHAAGNVELKLHEWNVDFACWCNYKYLNSGPGAVAAAYVHERYHTDTSLQRFAGWWGHKKESRFQMQKGFIPITDAEGWSLSTPSPILFAAHKASLEIFSKAGMQDLAVMGKLMSGYLLYLLSEVNQHYSTKVMQVITPAAESERGCQVSILMLFNGKAVFEDLSSNGVFADWREPNVIRIAPVPLYNTFEEVWKFVQILNHAIKTIISPDDETRIN